MDEFRRILDGLAEETEPAPVLANIDLDTGYPVRLGDYRRADETYRRLLERLTSKPDRPIPSALKQNLVDYFAGIGNTTRVEAKIRAQLQTLARMTTNP